ncbi:MAG: hypothetical protein CMI75_08375 [Candidatus Pelagibacter sp.]|nr:hypothetical protein [Candidatus Pelagibacter sp.]|tara:strand:- start:1586 stop:2002 length:417 start_codon:yes stop_codon:yes gene_type:complete
MSRDGNMHPNSLNNLRPFTKEGAREGQKNSVLARKANKEAREALKLSLNDWKSLRDEIKDEAPGALDVLRIAMSKAIGQNDMEEATRVATILAEFEAPKLQRQDINQVTKTADLTDDELEKAIQDLGGGFSTHKNALN